MQVSIEQAAEAGVQSEKQAKGLALQQSRAGSRSLATDTPAPQLLTSIHCR